VDKNVAFAEYLGCATVPEDYRIVVDPEAWKRVAEFLEESGVSEGNRIVYANPAARWESKFWTVEAWAELADLLIERTGAAVVFSGSPDDASHIRMIAERMKQRPIIAAVGSTCRSSGPDRSGGSVRWRGFWPHAHCRIRRDSSRSFVRPHRPGKGGTVRGRPSRDPTDRA
jgi:hypothetical protein